MTSEKDALQRFLTLSEEEFGLTGVCADEPDDEPVWRGQDKDGSPSHSKITFGLLREARRVLGRHAIALTTIAEWPITFAGDQDAHNMRHVAATALQRPPREHLVIDSRTFPAGTLQAGDIISMKSGPIGEDRT